MTNTEQLELIKDNVVACHKCALSDTRILPVVGQGSHTASLVFVGEAPGANEDKTGKPFCGRAGSVLDDLLLSAGIKRDDVYVCNILKCRPPNNRVPLPDEIDACTPYLETQINIIKPKVIGALGNYAASFVMRHYGLGEKVMGISKMRGCAFEVQAGFGKLIIVPLYHPAVAVYNQNMKETLIKDFSVLRDVMNGEEMIF